MKQEEVRQKLIDSAILVIARDGLDKASTKHIAQTAAVNEAYIYRCFADKEDLFRKVFDFLDGELLAKTMQSIEVMSIPNLEFETRSRLYFSSVWLFLLGNRDKCLTYMRYFYSPYFMKYSAQTHEMRFAPLVTEFKYSFKDEADVWMILNHILNVMFDFVVKVHNGQMSSDDDYVEHVFRVIYRSVEQYFKNSEESDS